MTLLEFIGFAVLGFVVVVISLISGFLVSDGINWIKHRIRHITRNKIDLGFVFKYTLLWLLILFLLEIIGIATRLYIMYMNNI